MRASQALLPTVKEDPAGAEAVSHRLMVRAGLVRQLSAGIYVFLPTGWRVMQKIAAIIREEMNGIGCQEMLMPVVNPAEIWQESGRWDAVGDELFRLKDRKGSDLALAMTHEEVVTWLAAREIRSYKQLPQLWYHIQTKERDEARPKSGLLRTREFIMKDSYSLDVDFDALQVSYEKHIGAYDRIFTRCGLRFRRVESDNGMMGGALSHEYMAPSEAGEDEVVFCRKCGYAANIELAIAGDEPEKRTAPGTPAASGGAEGQPLEHVHTPDTRTIEQVTALLGVQASDLIKSLVVVSESRGTVMVLVRGDHDLQELKLRRLIGEFRMATADEVAAALGAAAGFVGPVGAHLPILADTVLRRGTYVSGANKDDYHVQGVTATHYTAEFHDLHTVRAGDRCPQCDAALEGERVIEVGQIFQLGIKYSEPMGAVYLDENGDERPIVMGSYGIGLARIAAAAVEQNHDEDGIIWPAAIAPFAVHLVVVRPSDDGQRSLADRLYEDLQAVGLEILYDDRELSPGVKFKDADLLGCPAQVIVGKRAAEGVAELKRRAGGERRDVPVAELAGALRELLGP
jgi:prolyl-tRNA synthetase